MANLKHIMLAALLACACQPAATWASQIECKRTASNKRLCIERGCSTGLTRTQEQTPSAETLEKEAQLCHLSRHAQLRALLYELLDQVPLELVDIIIRYDNHLLTGTLQCTLNRPLQQTTAAIVSLTHSKNENIFYARTAAGLKYWCNAATGVIADAKLTPTKKRGKRTPQKFPEAPKLTRSQAIMYQSIVLPDGSVVKIDGDEITVNSPTIDNKSTVICTFKTGVVTKLLALSDGRLVTGMPNGQIKLWV